MFIKIYLDKSSNVDQLQKYALELQINREQLHGLSREIRDFMS